MPFHRVGPDGALTRLHLGIVQADGTIQPPLAAPAPQRGRVHELGVIGEPYVAPVVPQRGRVHEIGVLGSLYIPPAIPQRGRVHETQVVGAAWIPPDPDPQHGRIHEVTLEAIPA